MCYCDGSCYDEDDEEIPPAPPTVTILILTADHMGRGAPMTTYRQTERVLVGSTRDRECHAEVTEDQFRVEGTNARMVQAKYDELYAETFRSWLEPEPCDECGKPEGTFACRIRHVQMNTGWAKARND